MTSNWDKFVLLMWKNWLLTWRHKIQTIVEILVPVMFSALLVIIRSLVDPEPFPEPLHFRPMPVYNLTSLRTAKHYVFDIGLIQREANLEVVIDWTLVYSPQNDQIDRLMLAVGESLNVSLTAAENSSVVDTYLRTLVPPLAGVVFDDAYKNIQNLPHHLDYTLRFPSELRYGGGGTNALFANWRTDLLFPQFQLSGPRNRDSNSGGLPPGYYQEGFIAIQHAVSMAFINMTKQTTVDVPDVTLQRYPYPPFTLDNLLEGLKMFVSLIILLSFVYPCINNVKLITVEKEKQLKESMKIMGLPNWLHWLAWFTKIMIFMTISISLIVVLLKVAWYADSEVAVLTYSHWSTIWLFMFLYSIATTTYCFMLSVFFSSANTAASIAGILWFIIYAPYSFTQQNYELLSLGQKLLVSIFHNTGMAYGFLLIMKHEANNEGLQWHNIWTPTSVDDSLTIGLIMVMLILSTFLYLGIALYVEKVFPGSYGVPEPWYFPFTRKFWCGHPPYYGVEDGSVAQNLGHIEPDPIGKHAGIQIKGLRKVYSNKKVAVRGLTLNMYDDEITVLLGHNGAGKTTTMSMLTGMYTPTAGTALVNDKDILTDIAKVRDSVGLCPQHNILFDELTVREHIIFFSRLKGLDKKEVEAEIEKYVNLLELEPKMNAQSRTLSGGMKRKLSVGVALCGHSKVVLCDEPTSGMDPAARRALWDLLQLEKKGRTILLSTHFMDEADVLGDRIAILADGELKCCGSSFFLKKKFGVGYHLICVKGPECSSSKITSLLDQYVPGIKIENDIGTELSYALPDDKSEIFELMLSDLEERSDGLGIEGYGVSLTTLDEVFMKVGTDNNALEDTESITNGNQNGFHLTNGDYENGSISTINSFEATHLLTGARLMSNQWRAMFMKKFYYTLRNWVLLLIQNIIPMAFIILSILIGRTFAGGRILPPLKISLDPYADPVTILQRNFTNSVSPGSSIFEEYRKLFDNPSTPRSLIETDENIESHALRIAAEAIARFNSRYMVGASIASNSIIAWFNNQAHHTAPLTTNLIYNAILRVTCGNDCGISVTNHPVPFTFESEVSMLQAGNNMGFQLASNIGFAMAFVSSFYVLFYVSERVVRAKLLQFVSGVNIFTFWTTAFIWDGATFIITTLLSVVTLVVFQEDGWSTFNEMGRFTVLLLCFGWCMLPMIYLASLLFSNSSTGFTRMTLFNVFTGVACYYIVFIMAFENFDLKDVSDGLTWGFMIFPHFALTHALGNLNVLNIMVPQCNMLCDVLGIPSDQCTGERLCAAKIKQCCVLEHFNWESPGIGRNLIYLIVIGCVLIGVLLFKELRLIDGFLYKIKTQFLGPPPPDSEDGVVDIDVQEEKERIRNMSMTEIHNTNLVLKDMTKYYGKFLAVNQLCIGVDHSQCFGLLGVNGAGKTSTFKMLTGDENISAGEAWIKGISLKKSMKQVHQHIGYCPQFDALIDDLTGRETLTIFCLLRGVPNNQISTVSTRLAHDLNFMKHIDKKVKEYSGGNKRKLSTAVSLIGNPSVIYLDEPTTGMDPGAKRQLWNMICKVRNSGKTIILTSHSMEECEALCTQLAIMVNGEFKCLGSTQHLKNKFSKGFVLTIQIKRDNSDRPPPILQDQSQSKTDVDKIKEYVIRNLPGANLKEEYQGLLTYYITETNLKWSTMFGLMETAKKSLNIESYSLSQTSLEQVFLSFTKFQREEKI